MYINLMGKCKMLFNFLQQKSLELYCNDLYTWKRMEDWSRKTCMLTIKACFIKYFAVIELVFIISRKLIEHYLTDSTLWYLEYFRLSDIESYSPYIDYHFHFWRMKVWYVIKYMSEILYCCVHFFLLQLQLHLYYTE